MLEYKYYSKRNFLLEILSTLLVNMIVIILATNIFKNIYVENLFYTFLTALILMIFNKCLKPFISVLMLPLNVFTLGITYPFVNVITLKLVSLFLGGHFILSGWFTAFFISIFISVMTIIIDATIGRQIRKV